MGIFGAFINTPIRDYLGFYGSPDTFLFRYKPDYKSFHTYNSQGGQNFFYLNSKKIQNSKYPCGLGFGGEDYENFRIWLDADILEKSQSNDFDKTFENGALTDSSTNFLSIMKIEIWGFPDQFTSKKQQEFREQEEQIALGNRKVDRGEFYNNGTNQIMFSKQFGFRDQLRIDLDHEKEQMNKPNE